MGFTAHNLRIAAVAAVTGLVLLAGCGGSVAGSKPTAPAGLAGLPAKKIIAEATAAAKAAGWVSIVVSAKDGSATITGAGVIGPSEDAQTVKIVGAGQASVVVIGRVAYVRGSAAVVHGYLGLPAVDARTDGMWIILRPGDPGYQKLVVGATLDSFLGQLMPSGSLTKTGRTRMQGRAVVGVRGKEPTSDGGATVTLYVATSGKPLPVEWASNVRLTVILSRWGRGMTLTKPRPSIPAPAGTEPGSA